MDELEEPILPDYTEEDARAREFAILVMFQLELALQYISQIEDTLEKQDADFVLRWYRLKAQFKDL